MLGFVRQARTIADSGLQPIVLPSAPLAAILLLCAYPATRSKVLPCQIHTKVYSKLPCPPFIARMYQVIAVAVCGLPYTLDR